MDALTSARRLFGPCDHEHRSEPRRLSLLTSSPLPTLLSPTTTPPWPPHLHSLTLSSAGGHLPADPAPEAAQRDIVPPGSWQGLRTTLAGSPVGIAISGSRCSISHVTRYGRVVHLRQLPTPCCHDAVAFGCRRVNVPPDGDLHPAVWTPSQAHEGRPPWRPQTGSEINSAKRIAYVAVTEHGPPCTGFGTLRPGQSTALHESDSDPGFQIPGRNDIHGGTPSVASADPMGNSSCVADRFTWP